MAVAEWRRFVIEGTMTALTPLHIGAGKPMTVMLDDARVDVSATAMDAGKKPMIPAATVKGLLHEQAGKLADFKEDVRVLFGYLKEPATGKAGDKKEKREEDRDLGGRLLFQDLRFSDSNETPALFRLQDPQARMPLYWDRESFTYLEAGTAISRKTRTVARNKLFHYQVVPKATVFDMRILAEGISDRQLGLILSLLDRMDKSGELILGAGHVHDYGRMKWDFKSVSGLRTEEEVKAWLARDEAGFTGFPQLTPKDIEACRSLVGDWPAKKNDRLTLELQLTFTGPVMVNDPSQAVKASERGEGGLSHAYLKDENGQAVIKARSVRGALRAQTERIARTIFPQNEGHSRACYVDQGPGNGGCQPVASMKDVEQELCLTCRLFGGAGWRAPLHISDFVPVAGGQGEELTQDFVAIDRFTGGAAAGKKFKARYVYQPTLKGRIELELSRVRPEHVGLLALAMRDLLEGDVPLGFGKNKGFGHCSGEIVAMVPPARYPDWLKEFSDAECHPDLTRLEETITDDQLMCLQLFIEKLDGERTA